MLLSYFLLDLTEVVVDRLLLPFELLLVVKLAKKAQIVTPLGQVEFKFVVVAVEVFFLLGALLSMVAAQPTRCICLAQHVYYFSLVVVVCATQR